MTQAAARLMPTMRGTKSEAAIFNAALERFLRRNGL
jgi:hypothetical protein